MEVIRLDFCADTSKNYSSGVGFSTSSSTGRSRFSVAGSEDSCLNGEILPAPNLKTYSFNDLKTATRNFKSDTVLGVGGFGTVFKGWVDEKTLTPTKVGTGMVVAIKKLNSESMQGLEEWQVGQYLMINCRHLFFAQCCFDLFFVRERFFIAQCRKRPMNAKNISYLVADHPGKLCGGGC